MMRWLLNGLQLENMLQQTDLLNMGVDWKFHKERAQKESLFGDPFKSNSVVVSVPQNFRNYIVYHEYRKCSSASLSWIMFWRLERHILQFKKINKSFATM